MNRLRPRPVVAAFCLSWCLAVRSEVQPPPLGRSPQESSPDLRPLRVREVQGLRFGNLASESRRRGEARVDPSASGAVSCDGGARGLGGDYGHALIEVLGEPNAQVAISLPSSVHLARGVELRDLVARPSWTTRLGPNGRGTFAVGGRLVIASDAEAGTVRTPFLLEVDYL